MTANFANQDLRQRSFRGQVLNDADLSGSDLRGCDFAKAQLRGANFTNARLGTSGRQRGQLGAISLAVTVLLGNAIARLIAATIGQTPDDRAWTYGLVLFGCLTGAAWAMALQGLLPIQSGGYRWAGRMAATLAGALFGFFQIGSLSQKQPLAAIAGAILGGILLLAASWLRRGWVLPVLTLAGTVATYGATVMTGIVAIVCLSSQQGSQQSGQPILWGGGFAVLTVLYAAVTLRSCCRSVQAIWDAPGTSFRDADLTDAEFAGTDRQRADFTGAIRRSGE